MALESKTLKLCNCNGTMALDGAALARALRADAPVVVHTELCRRESGSFTSALKDDACVVACTQEAPLFSDIAADAGASTSLKFVNIREMAAWSKEGARATPKIAALLALADLPDPEPVPAVSFRSDGQVLIIGPADAALDCASRLAEGLHPSVLMTEAGGSRGRADPGAELPAERRFPIWSGKVQSVGGWLGAFEVVWEQQNPIDLDLCTRCNACVHACPEGAIDYSYRIDLDKCRAHRRCVNACGAIGAIDFDRAERRRAETFDLVLDLTREPFIRTPHLPQGYFAPGPDPLEQALAIAKLQRLVGEFEKPNFTAFNESICAHGRSGKTGCTNCIDTCSSGAIASAGNAIRLEPHLCAGCGGCATVCPSGALGYVYPAVPELGARLKRLLSVYRQAGGADACLLFHSENPDLFARLARRAGGKTGGRGLPARVLPLEVFHPASIGMDIVFGALAYGASQVILLLSQTEDAEYGDALRRQVGHAQTIVSALGYHGVHFMVTAAADAQALERELWSLLPAATVASPGTFNLAADKRTALEFSIEHVAKHAPTPRDEIPLSRGAPYGSLAVNRDACTLCLSCVGACPESALKDAPDAPRLRFIERNCVQCGLCVNTCPENALALEPRLLLTAVARQAVTIAEAEPFHCARCGKPFGVKKMIDAMVGRLASHSMFASGPARGRLQMCADCRIVDMMEHPDEVHIQEIKR